jgi:hypothetical protein
VPPLGHWNVVAWSCMIGIPVLVLLLFVFRKYEHSRRSLAEKITT